MQEPWKTNIEAAKRIFQYFGIEPAERKHGDSILIEGPLGDRTLEFTCPTDKPFYLGLSYRTQEESKSTAGVILEPCKSLDFHDSDIGKVAVVETEHGNTEISTWGPYSYIS